MGWGGRGEGVLRRGAEGHPADFQETGNREKFAKRSKNSRGTTARARPPRAPPCSRAPSRAPGPPQPSVPSTGDPRRPRAPLPRPRALPARSAALHTPTAPLHAEAPKHRPRSPPPPPPLLGSGRANPAVPNSEVPSPFLSPLPPPHSEFRTLPAAPHSASRGPPAASERGTASSRRSAPRCRQTSCRSRAGALTSRRGGQQGQQEPGGQEPLHPSLLPPLTAA